MPDDATEGATRTPATRYGAFPETKHRTLKMKQSQQKRHALFTQFYDEMMALNQVIGQVEDEVRSAALGHVETLYGLMSEQTEDYRLF